MNKELYFYNSIFNLYLNNSQIPNAGFGVFTKDLIPKDTYIDEYIGDIYSYNPSGCYVIEINLDYYIDAKIILDVTWVRRIFATTALKNKTLFYF
jgi:hypothetical protein